MRSNSSILLSVNILLLLLSSCATTIDSGKVLPAPEKVVTSPGPPPPAAAAHPAANAFDRYLQTDASPAADGFDFPVGDRDGLGAYTDPSTGAHYKGWYVATKFVEEYGLGLHPGEDWNGSGGGNSDLGQEVFAIGNGRVVFAEDCGSSWGNVVIIEHTFYENYERRKIRSLYAHLQEMKVRPGEEVKRRHLIATIGQDPEKRSDAHLHLELRWDETLPPTYWASSDGKDLNWIKERYAAPTDFIKTHRKTPVPQQEPVLVLVDQESYRMRIYRNGQMSGEYEISLGQAAGQKRLQGDNKTPKGMYFVIQKHRGEFAGPYGGYYGRHWIKINYPNKYDAARGIAEGIITAQQEKSINANWEKRAPTLETTRLGGGIGFHGWIEEWDNDGPRHLSWGCVVMHIYDISKLFDQIPERSMVVIF